MLLGFIFPLMLTGSQEKKSLVQTFNEDPELMHLWNKRRIYFETDIYIGMVHFFRKAGARI